VQYLSPEQASGRSASPTTDIYSLGIVAYECLAGKRPFTGESQVAIAMAQINEMPPDLPITVAEPVRNLVMSCIAKKPEDRPSSTANLARAATALRNGDIAGAAAAVPAVMGGRESPDVATVMMPTAAGYGAATQATSIIGAQPTTSGAAAGGGAPTDDSDKPTKNRSPWTWPLIVLIAILVLVLGGTIFALVNQNSPGTTPASTSASSSPPPTSARPTVPTPSATVAPTTVLIPEADLLGKTSSAAGAILTALNFDLSVKTETGSAAPTAAQVGTVYTVNPIGNVRRGTEITLTVYGPLPTVTAPATAPKETPASVPANTVKAGVPFNVSWSSYSCPSGTSLDTYSVTATGATVDAEPGTATTATLTPTAPVAGTVTVTYAVTCSGIVSDPSPTLTLTVIVAP
jgi:hypothetical protein